MEKYCRAGQATDDNMERAHCMLDGEVYIRAHSMCLIACPLQQWLQELFLLLRIGSLPLLFVMKLLFVHHVDVYFY